jgi:hypothetical protein
MNALDFADAIKTSIEDSDRIMNERHDEIMETYEARDEMKYKKQNRSKCMFTQTLAMTVAIGAMIYAVYTISNMPK